MDFKSHTFKDHTLMVLVIVLAIMVLLLGCTAPKSPSNSNAEIREKTEALKEKAGELITCSYGGLNVYEATYFNATATLIIGVANIGTINLTDINITAYKSDKLVGTAYINFLSPAEVITREIPRLDSKPEIINITAGNCPSVTDTEDKIGEA